MVTLYLIGIFILGTIFGYVARKYEKVVKREQLLTEVKHMTEGSKSNPRGTQKKSKRKHYNKII